MAIKFIFILVLLSGAISVTAFAGGGSPYDHGENHRHDSEGSAVGKPAACNVPGHFEAGMFQTVDIK
ncbi:MULTISPECIES: hypothetical protein [Cycloclasticus]|jgi:hypothetical protein|uniref:Uncharacterized protein n=1 Tax=Cycloclasticus zancles 78-ME TaxID=1198232 RepID=S5TFM9_9GAMM|nr:MULTISPECIES: hypothetical protein [Cycloclasticus]AGS39652.1 hypothetical protein CYCME_1323 [Cycloclasticus zancles 78-ME]MDF1690243.1 hypothetical protein [Cycloclasticus sp.]MDF1761793.1 hypothetical protein [Thalassolituus sp.]MDF1830324.1 hypothetical protein [Cycloclasticus pugetii]|tara:strand:- start:4607 stop:4807 length:201 start_codon:yes stop_codon:yes gene_type:complete